MFMYNHCFLLELSWEVIELIYWRNRGRMQQGDHGPTPVNFLKQKQKSKKRCFMIA